jgi:hypothetical protein
MNQDDACYVTEKPLDGAAPLREQAAMARKVKTELWPAWSRWALLAVAVTALLTIAATLNDIY